MYLVIHKTRITENKVKYLRESVLLFVYFLYHRISHIKYLVSLRRLPNDRQIVTRSCNASYRLTCIRKKRIDSRETYFDKLFPNDGICVGLSLENVYIVIRHYEG